MICPACSSVCLIDDHFCHKCHRSLPSGIRQSTLVAWTGGVSALLAVLFVFLVAPFESGGGMAAAACAAIPVAFAAACVGSLMGWVIGRVACEH